MNGIIRFPKKIHFSVCLFLAAVSGLLYFRFLYCNDNKYTWQRPASVMGIASLDMDAYEELPVYYLVDGWEYYDNKLLTPEQISKYTPDDYLYLGRYAGFDRGNPEKSPYGCATYRLTIFIDSRPQKYALEIPTIYSRWQIYINGNLEADSHHPGSSMLVFSAQDMIEIIVAVSDDNGLYSGFTHPPAFGSPKNVEQLLSQRLLIHSVGVTTAMLLAIMSMAIGFGYYNAGLFRKFGLLCLFIAGSTGYPLPEALKLGWNSWEVIERICYYGSFLMILLLQADICKVSKKNRIPAITASMFILLLTALQPFMVFRQAGVKYLYGNIMSMYKWFTAFWLISTSILAVRKRVSGSKILLTVAILFSCALISDRITPIYEPVRLGWPAETVGFFALLAIGLILCHNTITIYQKEVEMESDLELAAMKEKTLIEANMLKSQFLGNISHELKVPLTVVSGYAQLTNAELTDSGVNTRELQDNMRRIIREADRMEQMVSQLLDITKIETDHFSLDIEPVSIEELIHQAADVHFSVLNDQQNELLLHIQPNMPPLLCDGTRIFQVLLNLLSNACRHTSQGTITIRAEVIGKKMSVSVADTGEGIPKELLSGLFERYLHKGTRHSIPARGTGLGLYICKIIIEAHHGSISVSSTENTGTAFHFFLPVEQAAAMEDIN